MPDKDRKMKLLPEEETLFEDLRHLRNSIYDPSCYYTNDTLARIALRRPASKRELLQIDPSEEKYNKFGEAFLAVVKSPKQDREKISDTEILALGHIRRLEVLLYRLVHGTLQKEYQADWWFEGVPDSIRRTAADLHEASRGVVPKEYGLRFVDLKEIISKQWRLFSFVADLAKEDKKTFESTMKQLNDIRNRLCHPLRLLVQPITDQDAEFVFKTLTLLEKAMNDEGQGIQQSDPCD